MARTVTFGAMKLRARRYADMENSQFIEDDELSDYMASSICDLYDQLVAAYGEDYYKKSATFTTVANQNIYTFASIFPSDDFYKLIGIYRVNPNVTPEQNLGQLQRWERADRFYVSNSLSAQYPAYRLENQQINLLPVPAAGMTIRIDYVPASPITGTSSDLTGFDGINGWEDWACLDTAIRMLDKEESDTRALRETRARIDNRILQMGAARDANQPSRVTDAYTQGWPWWDRMPPP